MFERVSFSWGVLYINIINPASSQPSLQAARDIWALIWTSFVPMSKASSCCGNQSSLERIFAEISAPVFLIKPTQIHAWFWKLTKITKKIHSNSKCCVFKSQSSPAEYCHLSKRIISYHRHSEKFVGRAESLIAQCGTALKGNERNLQSFEFTTLRVSRYIDAASG